MAARLRLFDVGENRKILIIKALYKDFFVRNLDGDNLICM